MAKPIEDLAFEDTLQELSTIVQQLEGGDLKLEETVALYQRGQQLAERCQTLLDEVALRVQQLRPDGEVVASDLGDVG
jgi:exodeoxyribonuclease VII small subunit